MLARGLCAGKRCGVPLVEISPYLEGMKTKPLAFAVHLLTGSGAALALMALIAATAGNWRQMFGWLVLALIVDGIDGPLARRVDTKRNAANWDGVLLDLVVDYLTYVFIPAYALIYAGLIAWPWGLLAAIFIALTGVVYFADVRMKAEDNCFVGFPGGLADAAPRVPDLPAAGLGDGGDDNSARGRPVYLAEVHPSGQDGPLAEGEPLGLPALGGARPPGRCGRTSIRRSR